MLIFIDESGGFQITAKANQVSCVTAVVVPEGLAATLFRRFRKATRPWRVGHREIKGSRLDEGQMAAVLKVLQRFDIIVLNVCIDMGSHSDVGIGAHKNAQAERFLKAISPKMATGLRMDIEGIATRVRGLPNQLYVQAVVLNELVHRIIRTATLYYVQRIPKSLGAFRWRLDAKDKAVTEYEKLWQEIVLPFSQTRSAKDPMLQLNGADYSAFAPFEGTLDAVPDYLRPMLPDLRGAFQFVDIRKLITGDLKFSQSHRMTGLQIVDVVGSAIRRACNGTLGRSGWDGVGRLMVRPEKGRNSVGFITLEDQPRRDRLPPYDGIVGDWDRDAKDILTAATRRPGHWSPPQVARKR